MPDEEELRRIHDAHSAVLWRYVAHLTGDRAGRRHGAGDPAARVAAPAILAQPPESTRAWMFTVARHLVIDEVRSARSGTSSRPTSCRSEREKDRTDALFETLLVEEALGR